MTFPSTGISIERLGPWRRFPWLAVLANFAVLVASAAGMPTWLRWIALAALGVAWWRLVERRLPEIPGTLSLEADALRVDRGGASDRIPLTAIHRALVCPLSDGSARFTLALQDGALWAVMSTDDAAALRDAVHGATPPRPTEIPPLMVRERSTLARILFFVQFSVAVLLTALIPRSAPHPGTAFGVVAGVFGFITLILLPTQALETKAVAELDGIRGRGGMTSTLSFVPFAEVSGARVERIAQGRYGYVQCALILREKGAGISLPFAERTFGEARAQELAETIVALVRESAKR